MQLGFTKKRRRSVSVSSRNITRINLSDSDLLSQDGSAKFKNRCVLIGVVRNRYQFSLSIREKFYHVPMSQMTDCYLPVKLIALYQSPRFFGIRSGVRFIGEVESCDTVKRCEIAEIPKNSNEKYMYFRISRWHKLDRPIKSGGMDKVVFSTTPYLMNVAKTIPELSVRSEDELALYKTLVERVKNLVKNEQPDGDDITYGDHVIKLRGGILCVYFSEMIECAVGYDVFLDDPMKVVSAIFDYYPEV